MVLAAGLGVASVLGFAPFYLYPIPFLTLAGLFWLLRHSSTARQAAARGFAFGLGYFLTGVSWVYVSLHDFGAMPLPLAGLATLLFCAVLAMFPAFAALIAARLRTSPRWHLLIVLPAAWVLLEWVRGWILTGFPWLTFGYSQVPASPLAHLAPLGGIYLVSFGVAMTAGAIALLAERTGRLSAILAMVAVWGAAALAGLPQWTQPHGKPFSVALLQGNVAQEMKWRPEVAQATLRRYEALIAGSRAELIILPETAYPFFLDELPAEYLNTLRSYAQSLGGNLIIGIPERQGSGPNGDYYNSIVTFGSAPSQLYRKSHLVPFGEYIPLKPIFGWVIHILDIPLSDMSRGPRHQAPFDFGAIRVAPNVCYEDGFGEEIIGAARGATVLANISNDAWFGRSFGPEQHAQVSQARALETGRYMLRATNTGVTAIIDEKGRMVKRLPEFTLGVLSGVVQGYSGDTPYMRVGNVPIVLTLMILLAAALVRARRFARA